MADCPACRGQFVREEREGRESFGWKVDQAGPPTVTCENGHRFVALTVTDRLPGIREYKDLVPAGQVEGEE